MLKVDLQEVLLLAPKLLVRLHKTSSRVHFIRTKKYSPAILVHRYTMGGKMSIHFPKRTTRALHTLPSAKIMAKMILEVRLEETGGKDLFTTKSSPPITWRLHILKEIKYIEKQLSTSNIKDG